MSKYYDFELSSVLPRLTRDVLTIVDDYFAGDVSHCQNCADEPLLVNGFKPEQFEAVRIYCELKENDGTPTVDLRMPTTDLRILTVNLLKNELNQVNQIIRTLFLIG